MGRAGTGVSLQAAAGARLADTAAAVASAGIVAAMLANDAALEEVALGHDGFVDRLGKDGLHISMSTVSPETSRRLAGAHASRGSLFLAGRTHEPAGFRLELGMKDVRLVRDVAEHATLPMSLADLLHQRLLTSLA